jgi:hypothetical protein
MAEVGAEKMPGISMTAAFGKAYQGLRVPIQRGQFEKNVDPHFRICYSLTSFQYDKMSP